MMLLTEYKSCPFIRAQSSCWVAELLSCWVAELLSCWVIVVPTIFMSSIFWKYAVQSVPYAPCTSKADKDVRGSTQQRCFCRAKTRVWKCTRMYTSGQPIFKRLFLKAVVCAFGGEFLYCGNSIHLFSIIISIGANARECKVFWKYAYRLRRFCRANTFENRSLRWLGAFLTVRNFPKISHSLSQKRY